MTTLEAQAKVVDILTARYGDYFTRKPGERVLLAMSVLANDIRVREVGGNNRGAWVRAILASSGLPEGYAWCADSIEFCCQVGRVSIGPTKPLAAAVQNWRHWASQQNRLLTVPARGRLATLVHPDGTGHMGVIAEVRTNGTLRTYEGNTTAGPGGDQRDGGGLYERVRPAGFWSRFITLD